MHWSAIYTLLLPLFVTGCGIDRTIRLLSPEDIRTLHQYYQLDSVHQSIVTPPDEPGEKLHLALTFRDKSNLHVHQKQLVAFYHTSAAGEYDPIDPSDESTARLRGQAVTDQQGRILIRTILPGDYGSSADNRHIHMTVFDAHPEAYDLHFKQYSSHMSKRFIEGSDQHFLIDLKRDREGRLIGFGTIEVKSPKRIEG